MRQGTDVGFLDVKEALKMHEPSSYTPSTDPRMARTLEEEGSQVFNNGGSGDGVSKKWKERRLIGG